MIKIKPEVSYESVRYHARVGAFEEALKSGYDEITGTYSPDAIFEFLTSELIGEYAETDKIVFKPMRPKK